MFGTAGMLHKYPVAKLPTLLLEGEQSAMNIFENGGAISYVSYCVD